MAGIRDDSSCDQPSAKKLRYFSESDSSSDSDEDEDDDDHGEDDSDSSASSLSLSKDGSRRRMSVNAKTVFIQKVGENGLPETVYQVSESSAVEESSQDSTGAVIEARPTAATTTKATTTTGDTTLAFSGSQQQQHHSHQHQQQDVALQPLRGIPAAGSAWPASSGCPFGRTAASLTTESAVLNPPLPDDEPIRPPLPTEAVPPPPPTDRLPPPPPDEPDTRTSPGQLCEGGSEDNKKSSKQERPQLDDQQQEKQQQRASAGPSAQLDSDSDAGELDSDVDKMLDEGLEEGRRAEQVVLVNKTVCKRYTKDIFDVLPEDWVVVTHNCGLPVYLHRKARVCTWARPYFLGTGSARKHEVPQSAIPCLHYRRTKEKALKGGSSNSASKKQPSAETANQEEMEPTERTAGETLSTSTVEGGERTSEAGQANSDTGETGTVEGARHQLMNKVEIESAQDCQRSLSVQDMKDYARKVFDLEDIVVRKFKSWTARREFQREKKLHSRPLIPSTTHLVTCELPAGSGTRTKRKEFVLNPSGKGPVGILHEFVQHSLREQPKYIFKELSSSETPYCATLIIADIEYGTGYGSSKKLAKVEAARAALSILVPSWKEIQEKEKESRQARAAGGQSSGATSTAGSAGTGRQEFVFFDDIAIEDPRLAYLCTTTGQPSPFQILVQCLKRNFGLNNESDIKQQISKESEKSQKMEYGMSVGRHEARVSCKNKRDGKQLASQQLLAKMHPYLRSWGAILRLYGQGSFKSQKEKREEQNEITELQTRAASNAPNYDILNKLRQEMLKLAKEQHAPQNHPQSTEQIKMVDM